ncbi:hypothetical protein [Candidatus Poriferisodalis sp.]|uniref:hypothetical protein n=1 Tax=Candidatus Poriferisodalis sp. TaxID=3101277 RepID=UPI003B02B23D
MAAEAVRLSDMAVGRRDRLLPVADELVPLLTQPGLIRGSVLAAQGPGALTLATALVAEVSHAGGWAAAVGLGRMGISAVAERGVSLNRWAFVDEPGDAAAEVLNALVGNVDVILLAGGIRLAAVHSRRLRARLRERASVLIEIAEEHAGARGAGAFSPDVTLTVERASWTGLGQGHGRLTERRAEVVAAGRGAASLPRRVVLWLPDAAGRVMTVREATAPAGADRPAGLVDASRSAARGAVTGLDTHTDADAVVSALSRTG